jgi:hypothetical protein
MIYETPGLMARLMRYPGINRVLERWAKRFCTIVAITVVLAFGHAFVRGWLA